MPFTVPQDASGDVCLPYLANVSAACAAQIDRLWQQSNGGFGAYLLLAHNWASPQATLRSYELIAREVMPQFQGHAEATLDAAHRAKEAREGLAAAQSQAVEEARTRYQAESAERGQVALSG
jgi:limonene 1,2-monooxygenase